MNCIKNELIKKGIKNERKQNEIIKKRTYKKNN